MADGGFGSRAAARYAEFRLRLAAEMSYWPEYHYVIINRDIEASVA